MICWPLLVLRAKISAHWYQVVALLPPVLQNRSSRTSPAAEEPHQPVLLCGTGGGITDLSTMQEVILMSCPSDTMTEGAIAGWHAGDPVKGDLPTWKQIRPPRNRKAMKEGTLLYIGAQKGDKVPVNALLCIIGDASKADVDRSFRN